ncbi:DUF4185 domain-containing protein [Pseudonocardia charpentierae]|uniref:DUF4185 domain-containing protein n=1 Tax=Pseudonocardia charpentierae TaxID=3075545 RepID=A0ABU2N7M9_9PSEU|nr:DUF4185 domain-containing protein [Pseudonocardia sp. DSM 45834]MDT0349058.1 DUF4185 domain-containing protein [Pseudonocardia sp. DSM 45834]
MADDVVGIGPVPQIELVPGSVRKVCQLTGEWDRQRHTPAHNRTETRFGLVGTDLGASFEHDGRLWFLFGDTWPDPEGGDSVAWTTDPTPEPGIGLEFVSADSRFVRPRVSTPDGRPVSTTFFEVPLDGFSAGGHMYVFRTTEHYREAGREVMGRSILTRAVNGDPTDLVCLYDLSIARRGGKFINVSCVVADEGVEGLPFSGTAVLVWGSGLYRASDAYLACVPLGAVEDRSRWRFWCGREARSRRPVWSESESDAVALFAHPQIGELSVTWNAPLGVWLMLYNAGSPRGINARVARHPWGPWSDPVVVFDPGWAGTGYGEFMHVRDAPDGLSDPGRENEWGGEYGPYVIDRYTRALPGRRAAVYFTMSTWNPYNVVAMTAVLRRVGTSGRR